MLAFWEFDPKTGTDLMLLPLDGDEASGWKAGTPVAFLNDATTSIEPMFSPDGRWIAYFSNETGRFEVYVRPYPGPGGKVMISSTAGANSPVWSRSRRELLFGGLDGTIMTSTFAIDSDVFRPEKPRQWTGAQLVPRVGQRLWDLHPDGQRAAAAIATQAASRVDKVVLFLNFFDELKRLAPANR